MGLTTLCYLEKDDRYLMLHRIKKEVDVNKDKWIGVGGHFEKDETPEECLLRSKGRDRAYAHFLAFPGTGHVSFRCMGNGIYVSLHGGWL